MNDGKLEVTGTFTNSDLTSVVFDNQSKGTVALSGGSQEIAGSRIVFPSLALSNGDKALKTDIDVAGILSLGNRRLDVGDYTIHITNPSSGAVVRDVDPSSTAGTGFITTAKGALIRNTNSNSSYLFPLGSATSNPVLPGINPLYRPLDIKPEDASPNTFSASLINDDPTNAGYDKTKKRFDVKTVSDKYYFILGQNAGSSNCDITFYQNSTIDNNYTQLVNWTNFLKWEKAAPSTVVSGSFGDDLRAESLNTSIKYTALQPFHNLPFTFSSEIGGVNPFTFYNAFSPDGDNKNDVWMINNIDLYPDNKLSIYNRWGDEVYSAKGYSNATAWDGGNLQPGTYYYVLTATIENQSRVFKGFITMIKKN